MVNSKLRHPRGMRCQVSVRRPPWGGKARPAWCTQASQPSPDTPIPSVPEGASERSAHSCGP
eukprot:9491761-Pyramimonas_sp.AAC.1